MGQRADRDEVHAGRAHVAYPGKVHVSGRFELCFARTECNRFSHLLKVHVVQHDRFNSQVVCFDHLVHRSALHLDSVLICPASANPFNCGGYRSSVVDVVVFEQHHIVQPHAVVPATTDPHRIF